MATKKTPAASDTAGKVLKKIPSSETIAETYNDTINNRILITTENRNSKTWFKLYLKTDKGYIFLKSRKKDPYFDETHPF